MDTQDDDRTPDRQSAIVRFPASRTVPRSTPGGFTDLGTGAMARRLGMRQNGMTGHWCSRCRGVWFGYALEVECPCCGNRHG